MGGRLKLLVLVNHFAPDRGGGGATYTDMCHGLAERGIAVTVGCPYPFYPQWRDTSGRNGLRLWRYRDDGVDVIRFGLFIPRNPRSLAQRTAFELSLFISALRLLPQARKADVVMVYCPYFGMVMLGAIISTLLGKPCWLNVQDVMSEAAHKTGMFKSATLARLLAGVERLFFNRYPAWSTISPVMVERLQPVRRRNQEILLLPNWLDNELRARILQPSPRPRAQTPVRLLYAGNISGKQDFLRFCRFLKTTTLDFRLRIFGDGGEASKVRAWVDDCGDARFSFAGFLGAADLARELAAADFHVITEKAGAGASFFPSKYVGAITAGAPILAICDRSGPLGSEIAERSTGALLSWQALNTLPALLRASMEDGADWQRWRANALQRAQDFDRDALLDQLAVALARFARRDGQRMRA